MAKAKAEELLDKKIDNLIKRRSNFETQIKALQKKVLALNVQIEKAEKEKNTEIINGFLSELKDAGCNVNSNIMNEVLEYIKTKNSTPDNSESEIAAPAILKPIEAEIIRPEETDNKFTANEIPKIYRG